MSQTGQGLRWYNELGFNSVLGTCLCCCLCHIRVETLIGLLWHDSSKRPLIEILPAALEHYAKRVGGVPAFVAVHADCYEEKEVLGMRIVGEYNVLQYHYFLVEGEQ